MGASFMASGLVPNINEIVFKLGRLEVVLIPYGIGPLMPNQSRFDYSSAWIT
jgi:hypothetical protein